MAGPHWTHSHLRSLSDLGQHGLFRVSSSLDSPVSGVQVLCQALHVASLEVSLGAAGSVSTGIQVVLGHWVA